MISPMGPDDLELRLDPEWNPAAKAHQDALLEQGIPLQAFAVDDIRKEDERLRDPGVVAGGKATRTGPATTAVFEDACGNLLQLNHI